MASLTPSTTQPASSKSLLHSKPHCRSLFQTRGVFCAKGFVQSNHCAAAQRDQVNPILLLYWDAMCYDNSWGFAAA